MSVAIAIDPALAVALRKVHYAWLRRGWCELQQWKFFAEAIHKNVSDGALASPGTITATEARYEANERDAAGAAAVMREVFFVFPATSTAAPIELLMAPAAPAVRRPAARRVDAADSRRNTGATAAKTLDDGKVIVLAERIRQRRERLAALGIEEA